MSKTGAIVHFNTPELTEACVLSVRKHGGKDYRIVVFDNSDKRPFPKNNFPLSFSKAPYSPAILGTYLTIIVPWGLPPFPLTEKPLGWYFRCCPYTRFTTF